MPVITGVPVGPRTQMVVLGILGRYGIPSIAATCTARSSHDQARVMYENCAKTLFAEQYRIYKDAGDSVVKVADSLLSAYLSEVFSQNRDQVIAAMEQKINELGPRNVSAHCAGPDSPVEVTDFDKASIQASLRGVFFAACQNDPSIAKVLDENGCYHLEVFKTTPGATS